MSAMPPQVQGFQRSHRTFTHELEQGPGDAQAVDDKAGASEARNGNYVKRNDDDDDERPTLSVRGMETGGWHNFPGGVI